MTTVLLDTHALHWWSAEPERISPAATEALLAAEELAVSAVSWWELSRLARERRIVVLVPIRSWLALLARNVRTAAVTPAVAETAAALPATFAGDAFDQLIYATALERGWPLVTKDERLRDHRHPSPVTIW
jgi:PIN domain nuclease of toxin-antitoxin system